MSRILIAAMIAAQLLLSAGSVAAAPTSESAVYWIDVRTPEEFKEGHLPGYINIEYQDIAAGVKELDTQPGDTIYLHCRSGRRSGVAQETLESMGYTHAVNLGGYEDAEKFHASHRRPAQQ